MQKAKQVTLLALGVLSLVSSFFNAAQAAELTYEPSRSTSSVYPSNNKTIMSADQVSKPTEAPEKAADFHMKMAVSRNTSLVDFQDGSRKDGLEYLINPSVSTQYGKFATKLSYSQNIKETNISSDEKSDFSDIPLTYIMKSNKWMWAPPYVLMLTPTITTIVPISNVSVKKDQLQTALIGGLNLSISPDGIAPNKDGGWNFTLGLTAGKNFHAYSEDINGRVLNQYSSNQTLGLGYSFKKISVSAEYVHKSRWTYQGNTKDGFELSQEVEYALNDNFSLTVGHTNAGSLIKANGTESNLYLVNENDSVVYLTMGLSF